LLADKVEAGQATTLHMLIHTIFAPYRVGEPGNRKGVIVSGTDVPIGGSTVTNLALLLHELATNAAKYGALSSEAGTVQIDCSIDNGTLLLIWRESGGPVIEGSPNSEGFGGVLSRRIVATHFGGEMSREWTREGLVVRLSVPADRLDS
jgi:two-component sensor histidine kinase